MIEHAWMAFWGPNFGAVTAIGSVMGTAVICMVGGMYTVVQLAEGFSCRGAR